MQMTLRPRRVTSVRLCPKGVTYLLTLRPRRVTPWKMQPCDKYMKPKVLPYKIGQCGRVFSPVFVVNLLWTQTLLTQWKPKLFLALTLLFSINGKTNVNGFQMKFQIQLMHFSLQWKTLVGSSSSYKTKLGQIILRKVVVAWDKKGDSEQCLPHPHY